MARLQAAHGGLGFGAEVAVGADVQRALQLLDRARGGFFDVLFLRLRFQRDGLSFGFRFGGFDFRRRFRAAGGGARVGA